MKAGPCPPNSFCSHFRAGRWGTPKATGSWRSPCSSRLMWFLRLSLLPQATNSQPKAQGQPPHLFVLLGHPLVPVVEHVQPLGLPLPQHLQGDFLQPVEQRAGPIRGAKRSKGPGLGPSHQSGQAFPLLAIPAISFGAANS